MHRLLTHRQKNHKATIAFTLCIGLDQLKTVKGPLKRNFGNCSACRRRPLRIMDPRPFTVVILTALAVFMIMALVVLAAR